MPVLKVTIINKHAQSDGQSVVCDNNDYKVKFYFDEEWDAHDPKTMRVVFSNGEYNEVVFTGDECDLPIIQNKNRFEIGVYAGNLHTTVPAKFDCEKSILTNAKQHTAPSQDVYNQIIALIDAGRLKGEDGVSPEVTITDIDNGHSVTITDANHPSGQSFDVMNGDSNVPEPDSENKFLVSELDEETGDVCMAWAEKGAYVEIPDAPNQILKTDEDSITGEIYTFWDDAPNIPEPDTDNTHLVALDDGQGNIEMQWEPIIVPFPDTAGKFLKSLNGDNDQYAEWEDLPIGDLAEIYNISNGSNGPIFVNGENPPYGQTVGQEIYPGRQYAILDYNTGVIKVRVRYHGQPQWRIIDNGFVICDSYVKDDFNSDYHFPTIAWAKDGHCDYAPVVVDDSDYNKFNGNIPYKCVPDGNYVLSKLAELEV